MKATDEHRPEHSRCNAAHSAWLPPLKDREDTSLLLPRLSALTTRGRAITVGLSIACRSPMLTGKAPKKWHPFRSTAGEWWPITTWISRSGVTARASSYTNGTVRTAALPVAPRWQGSTSKKSCAGSTATLGPFWCSSPSPNISASAPTGSFRKTRQVGNEFARLVLHFHKPESSPNQL